MNRAIYNRIEELYKGNKKSLWVLIDPDDYSPSEAASLVVESQDLGVNTILVGGSLIHSDHLDELVKAIKEVSTIPVILFPGDAGQLTPHADALLFMSLVSGRNPDFLIGEQVKGAAFVKRSGIEPIPMGYLLIESGAVTSVEFMSNTRPIPRDKEGIAAMHALASQYLGQKLIYLEAGSGAKYSVPPKLIATVKATIEIPIIVGGGIRDAETAKEKIDAGADILVIGNLLSKPNGREILKEIAEVI